MRLVKIEWLDAHGDGGGWMQIDEIGPVMPPCMTVGFVVKENDEFLCVIQSHGFDGQYYNHLCIPKAMIIEIVDLLGG